MIDEACVVTCTCSQLSALASIVAALSVMPSQKQACFLGEVRGPNRYRTVGPHPNTAATRAYANPATDRMKQQNFGRLRRVRRTCSDKLPSHRGQEMTGRRWLLQLSNS